MLRYAQPVQLTEDCLICHGNHAGEKDPFGYAKERMKVGDLRGAFVVTAPLKALQEASSANSLALMSVSGVTLLAAVKSAEATSASISRLSDSSLRIGQVIKVITTIAHPTNLLALNATIEAARAGEAGKGFAVVAGEVKELAKQTAKATEDISQRIAAIQLDTKGAVGAIGDISSVIRKINDISTTIATAVEEQSATTTEMSRNLTGAAKGSGDITHNIKGVTEAAHNTSSNAQDSLTAAQELARLSKQLGEMVAQFKLDAAAGRNGHENRGA